MGLQLKNSTMVFKVFRHYCAPKHLIFDWPGRHSGFAWNLTVGWVELQNKEVKTRKDHDCIWCGESVPKGSIAQYRSGIWEGQMTSDYFHPECYSAMCRTDIDYIDCDGFEPYNHGRGIAMQDDPLYQ